jgi:hypothetical protein
LEIRSPDSVKPVSITPGVTASSVRFTVSAARSTHSTGRQRWLRTRPFGYSKKSRGNGASHRKNVIRPTHVTHRTNGSGFTRRADSVT